MDTTNFYYPGLKQRLVMSIKEIKNSESDEVVLQDEEKGNEEDAIVGFIGTQTGDIPYERALELFEYHTDFEELIPSLESDNKNPIKQAVIKNRSPLFYSRREHIPEQTKAEIIMNWVYLHEPKHQEAFKRKLKIQQTDNIIYEFYSLKRITKKIRKSINMKRPKIKKKHIKWLQKFTENHFDQGFSLVQAKTDLIQNFPDLEDLSLSTVSTLMHKELKLSYKKLGNTNPTKVLPESRINLASCWKLIIGMIEGGFHLIFVDEFLINRNTISTYGWTQRGAPGRLIKRPTDFRMSFVVTHSQERVEGLMGTKSTFNQIKYVDFIKKLVMKSRNLQNTNHRRITIVADNCRFHRTKMIKEFFTKENIIWIFIPPYSPEINPCEKLINMIKTHIKTQIDMQK